MDHPRGARAVFQRRRHDRVVAPALEPLAVLALAAGATRRIRLMTSIVLGRKKRRDCEFPVAAAKIRRASN
jgi:alkanesulfonate monooxygenase SsuD/methylene tetrahydromethanopterin reductase-like flavin-dependent oxidoreductase (luciferase family)